MPDHGVSRIHRPAPTTDQRSASGLGTSEAPSSSAKGARRLLTAVCLVPPGDAGALAAKVARCSAPPTRMSARNLVAARPYHEELLRRKSSSPICGTGPGTIGVFFERWMSVPPAHGLPCTLGRQREIDGHREAVLGERVPRQRCVPNGAFSSGCNRSNAARRASQRGARRAGREADVREVLGCGAVLVEHDAGVAVGRDRVLRRPLCAADAPEQEGQQEQRAALSVALPVTTQEVAEGLAPTSWVGSCRGAPSASAPGPARSND